jgi:phosphate uptake regulator
MVFDRGLRMSAEGARQSSREKSEKQIGVRLPRELIEYIEGESKKNNVSTSVIVREAIEFYGLPHLWARRSRHISESLKSDSDLGRYASYEKELGNNIRFLKDRLKAYERLLKDFERRYEMFRDLKEKVRRSLEKIQRDIKDGSDPQE